MVCLGLDSIRYQFLAFYQVKVIRLIVSPCASGKMEREGSVLETKVAPNRNRPHLMLTRCSKCPTYNITVTQSRVGTTLIDLDLTALFDTGTSFTYLVDPAYSRFSESFHSQVKDRRRPPDPRIPFEYCYDMSPDANTSLIPTVSLTMKGGGQFALSDPIIVISTQHELIYCLALIRSAELNIIGQNFMTGYRVVFDKEKLILGWKKSNCYDIDDANSILARSHNSTTAPPAVAAGLGNSQSPKSTRNRSNHSHHSVASNLTYCFSFFFVLYLVL